MIRPRRLLLPLLAAALAVAGSPSGAAQGGFSGGKKTRNGKGGHDRPVDASDREAVESLTGAIPLGATATGMIHQGFYNTLTFEAVRGTVVTLELGTRHRTATLLAELLGPDRQLKATFEADEEQPRRIGIADFTLDVTGKYTIRFGFTKEENGAFELRTDARFPELESHTVRIRPGGEASLPIEGMLGRRLARCEFLLPDGVDVSVRLVHERGFEEDLSEHTRRMTFGRRVKVTDFPIDSNTPLELRIRDVGEDDEGDGAQFEVEIEYENPPLSRKRIKI